MILVDHEIKKAVETGELIIDPFIEEYVGATSYDVTMSSHFTVYANQVFDLPEPIDYKSFSISDNESIVLVPSYYDTFYDSDQELLIFRSKYQPDLTLCPDEINLATFNDEYAIFTAVLASTNEYVKLPDTISAEYTGRSSLGRIFLQSHQTAGWLDAGFEGTVTLELIALDCPVILHPNMKIGQLIFYKHNKCDVPYSRRKSSKYNKQVGATPTRIHLEY